MHSGIRNRRPKVILGAYLGFDRLAQRHTFLGSFDVDFEFWFAKLFNAKTHVGFIMESSLRLVGGDLINAQRSRCW